MSDELADLKLTVNQLTFDVTILRSLVQTIIAERLRSFGPDTATEKLEVLARSRSESLYSARIPEDDPDEVNEVAEMLARTYDEIFGAVRRQISRQGPPLL